MDSPHPEVTHLVFGSCAVCESRTRQFCQICNIYICRNAGCRTAHAAAITAYGVLKPGAESESE